MKRRFCLTLDLKDDPKLIAEYKRYHEKIWPEITRSIKDSGIEDMEIYLLGTRMFMIMEVNESFSFEAKTKADQLNPRVQEWPQDGFIFLDRSKFAASFAADVNPQLAAFMADSQVPWEEPALEGRSASHPGNPSQAVT
jgi:L-rhamnose mutarotase